MKLSERANELAIFPDQHLPTPEVFGMSLRNPSIRELILFCEKGREAGAELYAHMCNIHRKIQMRVCDNGLPYDEIDGMRSNGVMPLLLESALNTNLKDRFFSHPEIVHFADVLYMHRSDHISPELLTVGTTAHGLSMLAPEKINQTMAQQVREKSMHDKLRLTFTYADMRRVLHHRDFTSVRIHGLGPRGTNIEQVCHQYLKCNELDPATDSRISEPIIHEKGIEPPQYADIARDEKKERGVLPLHVECAVFYGMRDLYHGRVDELVFADHHPMPLDQMQLACRPGDEDRTISGKLRYASHPSPVQLAGPMLDAGDAQWVKASSNSHAAQMVRDGEADICITTEQGRQISGLHQLRNFGSPTMLFTIGTPYTPEELRRYTND